MIDFEALAGRAAPGEFRGLYVASDAIDPAFDEADGRRRSAPRSSSWSCRTRTSRRWPRLADVVLAGATFAEKAGCYVNADGRLQYAEARPAAPRRQPARPRPLRRSCSAAARGPIRSRDVLAELAEAVPAFAVAGGRAASPTSASSLGRGAETGRPAAVPLRRPLARAPRGQGDRRRPSDRAGEPTARGDDRPDDRSPIASSRSDRAA